MEANTLDPSKLSTADLKALLDQREKEEKQVRIDRKNQFEADKNKFVEETGKEFKRLQEILTKLKSDTILKANELYDRMYTIDDKEPKETKSFSLKNSDDTIKVVVERQERFEFTDEAIVHINAIKDIFKNKFAQRNKGLYEILDGLLIKGTKGEYDPKLLAKARNQVRKLGDDKLIAEFDKLDDCQRVTGTAQYCRLYMRLSKTGELSSKAGYTDVSLQFSSL